MIETSNISKENNTTVAFTSRHKSLALYPINTESPFTK